MREARAEAHEAEASWEPPRHSCDRPLSPLRNPFLEPGRRRPVEVRRKAGERQVLLRPEGLEYLVDVLRRAQPAECREAWQSLLWATGRADPNSRMQSHTRDAVYRAPAQGDRSAPPGPMENSTP